MFKFFRPVYARTGQACVYDNYCNSMLKTAKYTLKKKSESRIYMGGDQQLQSRLFFVLTKIDIFVTKRTIYRRIPCKVYVLHDNL